jgi:hypothetical protein
MDAIRIGQPGALRRLRRLVWLGVLAWPLGIGAAPAFAANLADGLVLWYSFDAPPKNGKVLDESGRGNHGKVKGPAHVQDGGSAGAYRFDGVDDFVSIPATASLNVGAGTAYTLAVWYNTSTDAEANRQSPLLEWGGTTVEQDGVHLWANTYGYQWNGQGTGANLVDTTGNDVPYVISTADRPRNEWHHLVVTYDRAAGAARVYVDGTLDNQKSFTSQSRTSYPLYLGKRPWDYQRLQGFLDEVRVYNRALSAEEVEALFARHARAFGLAPCQHPDLVRLEADYIAACQYTREGDPASGAINNVTGSPTWVVPRENAMAILGLVHASQCLGEAAYRVRADAAMSYLVRVQQTDGGWADQYSYTTPFIPSKSPTQTAEVMIAMNKLGYQAGRYNAMVKGAEFLLKLQSRSCKQGKDDGLLGAGLDAQGRCQTWRWSSDNAYGYQALKAASRWARLAGDATRRRRYDAAAARVLKGINTVLKDPASAVWRVAVDAQNIPVSRPHEWINYAPQMLDVPAAGVGSPAVGEWINQVLVNQATGGAVWDDGSEADRLSPGYSFQASLVWLDLGQTAYRDRAWQWVNASGLHQTTADANGIAGGWIDWKETGGAQAQWWERFIDTSFYHIAVSEGGYDFSAE